MIWRSARNILWALVRNFLQGKHQCTMLEQDEQFGWEWECSCGHMGVGYPSALTAIKRYSNHLKAPWYKTWGRR